MRIISGVDTSKLPGMFEGYVPGRCLIFDADGPCYVASSTSKTLATALRKFHNIILEQVFLTNSHRASLHLTSSTCFKAGRFNIIAVQPYQGQRESSHKPALLEALRQAVANPQNWLKEYSVTMNHMVEADDAMITEAYELKEHGLVWSGDKDLRMTPYPYWEQKTGTIVKDHGFGRLYLETTPSGLVKCLGYGLKFFWAQMLMGDGADYIKGITKFEGKLCGPATTFAALDKFQTETQVCNQVVNAYRKINQNPIPEGWLLWLLRNKDDTFWKYLNELRWTPENRAFLDDCVQRAWFKPVVEDDNGPDF